MKNFLQPSDVQFRAFRDRQSNEPIQMLNLLKFKDKASYEDGRESDLSGVEAYKLYTSEFRRLMEPQGVSVVYSGVVRSVVIGEEDLEGAWDAMVLIQYPIPK